MKALTICEPYASLISLPAADPRAKRVENRTWPTNYRGQLAIHAGKSRKYLAGDNYGFEESELTFGAIIAVANLVECVPMALGRDLEPTFRLPSWVERKYGLEGHPHVEGPVCWVLEAIRRLTEPIECSGKQGLWSLEPAVVREVLRRASGQ